MDEILQGRLMRAAQKLHSGASKRLEVPENMADIRDAIEDAQSTFRALSLVHKFDDAYGSDNVALTNVMYAGRSRN